MKRNVILLLILLLLAGGTYWAMTTTDSKNTISGEDWQFAVEDTDQIHKIFLADRKGNKTTLERKGEEWIYNGQHKASPNAVENLLSAVSRVQLKNRPPQAAIDNMIKDLATLGVKTELYDKEGNLIKSYYIGGVTPDERGTFMIMEGSDNPYVVSIPNWEGNIFFRYNLTGYNWRDKTVFKEPLEAIKAVSIEYPKQQGKSFKLERVEDEYEVEPYYDFTPKINKELKPGIVESFLIGFESLGAEAFESENPKRDSISALVPFSIIKLTDIEGNTKEVRLHPIVEDVSATDPKGGNWVSHTYYVERFFADVNGEELMLVQNRVFQKILWGYEFFY